MTPFAEERAKAGTGPRTKHERAARLALSCAVVVSVGWLVVLAHTLDGLRVAMDGRHVYAANHVPSAVLAVPLVVTALLGAAAGWTKTRWVRVLALLLGIAMAYVGARVWWWHAFVWNA